MYDKGDIKYNLMRIRGLANAGIKLIDGSERKPVAGQAHHDRDDKEFHEMLYTLCLELYEQAEHLDKLAQEGIGTMLEGPETISKE